MVSEVDTALRDLITDRKRYIETLMKVKNKRREEVPFTLNRSQSLAWPHIRPGGRLLVLKARQMGSTTLYIAKFLADCLTVPGTVSVIASENEFATQRALTKAHSLYHSIPDELKPPMHHNSSYEITWPSINSTMFITTARSNLLIRGDTVHNFLATEISRWPDPEGAMSAAEEAVPLDSGFIAIESTPWGEGDYFHTKIQESRGDMSSYDFLFLPWPLDPEYTIPRGSHLALPNDRGDLSYTPEEQDVAELFDLDEDQIRWRRRKRADRGLSFYQEFPEDPDKCFLTSGEAVFDNSRLDELAHGCYPAPETWEGARIWEPPTEKGIYLISADPTVGEHDKAAAIVWALGEKLTHVATYWGLLEPAPFAWKLKRLGEHYNMAEVQVEFNGPGQAVINEMMDYPNLGKRSDLATGKLGTKFGWLTTRTSKPYMIAQMSKEIYQLVTYDLDLVRQLRSVRWYGTDITFTGEDDLAMAAMIGTSTYQGVGTADKGLIGTYGFKW
ncbi:hypothetical protein LCGC14_0665080 [marine sediment metagenome]|uniref:Terminase large subunit gp17-like C-terminal domain-containing protein n=1 Tax=marine sediment metagenome TaxID=412755 RepID=A0A0F9QXK5_9ZZZZ